MRARATLLFLLLASSGLLGCREAGRPTTSRAPAEVVLTLGAYTTPREAYGQEILPAYARRWESRGGPKLLFRESYLGSGAQSRAIVSGFEADIAALSLEPDIERLCAAGLVAPDWNAGADRGIVTRSIVVIGVRAGNPKGIHDWADLARSNVEVLTPNVRTSGGAMWNVLALYGASLRGHAGRPVGDEEGAAELLGAVLANVRIMDRGARDSMLTFERGVGDAVITYENEILVGRARGLAYEYVVPDSTILIENPAAVVSRHAEKHGVTEAARDFLAFLHGAEAQRAYAAHGLRPVHAGVAAEVADRFPPVRDLFTIRDLGGWERAQEILFRSGGLYDRALERTRRIRP